jgi:hypothetical protein
LQHGVGLSRCWPLPGAEFPQHAIEAAKDEVMYLPGIAKADFMLGGMHIDVNTARIEFEIQHEHRMSAMKQHVTIGLAYRMTDHFVAHRPAINEEQLLIGLAAIVRGQTHPAPQSQTIARFIHRHTVLHEIVTEQAADTLQRRLSRWQFVNRLVVLPQAEADGEMGQRQAPHHVIDLLALGAFGAQKLAPRRGVVKQVQHFNGGAHRVRAGLEQ